MEQEQVKDNLAVNETLESVSDRILNKKKKKRKITLAIISAVVLIIAIAIITLASIKVDLKPYFIVEPSRYTVVFDGKTVGNYSQDDEGYQKLNKELKNSFVQPVLTAIFNGQLGGYNINEGSLGEKFYNDSQAQTGMSSALSSYVGSSYIQLHYGIEQTMFNDDKSVFYSSIYTNKYELKYVDIYIPIQESSENVTIYFGTYGEHVQSAYISSITIKVNTAQIYDYISQL